MKRIFIAILLALMMTSQVAVAAEDPKPEYTEKGQRGTWFFAFSNKQEYIVYSAYEMYFVLVEDRNVRGNLKRGAIGAFQTVPGKTIGLVLLDGVLYRCNGYEQAKEVYLKLGKQAADNGWKIHSWTPPEEPIKKAINKEEKKS